jgi:predicted RNA-binding Zn-ribbon protein involved in translation (DUF1610 family)
VELRRSLSYANLVPGAGRRARNFSRNGFIMKMRCEQCGFVGEKINFMKLDTADKTLAYVDACPECGSDGPFEQLEEPERELHPEAQAVADRVFEEQRRAVLDHQVSDDTLITDEELKNLDLEDGD